MTPAARPASRRRTPRILAGAAVLALLVAAAAACGGSDSTSAASDTAATPAGAATRAGMSSDDTGSGAGVDPAVPTAIPSASATGGGGGAGPAGGAGSAGSTGTGGGGVAEGGVEQAAQVPGQSDPNARQAAIISTGDIVLRAKDVEVARGDVLSVLDSVSGTVADERTTSDEDGHLTSSNLVLRVPSRTFTGTVARIGDIGTRVSSVTHSDDVTTQVVDVASRLSVQRASVARIRLLLNRAESIRDIVSIESQLSQREAALESLEQQRAYLADQTSLSTITVRVERIAAPTTVTKVDPASFTVAIHGFGGGLSAGWAGLRHFAAAVALVLGVVLPWLVVLLILGVPALLVSRRLRGRRRTVEG